MHTTDAPLVSVLIPTHNRKNELIAAITSVFKQSIQSFEIFILDDASTEDLNDVVEQFKDTRIIHHRNNEKSNANVLRNMGLRLARGKYVAFLDSDDEWLSSHLESKINFLVNSGSDGVFGSCFIDNGLQRKYAVSRPIATTKHPINYLLSDGFAPIPSWVLKASCAKKISFDETLKRHQDYDYFIRFAQDFKWAADWEPTMIVNWPLGVTRNFDFDSERSFVAKYINHLERRVLCQYCYTRFHQWKKLQNHAAMSFYRGLMLSQIDFITFNQFNQLQRAQGKWLFPLRWLHFSSLLLIKHFLKKA